MTEQSSKGYFSPDHDFFYYRNLTFYVDYNLKRKKTSIVLCSRTGKLTIKTNKIKDKNNKIFRDLIDQCYDKLITQYNELLSKIDLVSQEALAKCAYKNNDLFYIWGMPFILEVHEKSAIESIYTQEPKQVVQNAIAEDKSRFYQKYEILRQRGYYHQQALENMPRMENGYLTLPAKCLLKSSLYPPDLKTLYCANPDHDAFAPAEVFDTYRQLAYQTLLDAEEKIKAGYFIDNDYIIDSLNTMIKECYQRECCFDLSLAFTQATKINDLVEIKQDFKCADKVSQQYCNYILKLLRIVYEQNYYPQLVQERLNYQAYPQLFEQNKPYMYKGKNIEEYFKVYCDQDNAQSEPSPIDVFFNSRLRFGDLARDRFKNFKRDPFWVKEEEYEDFSFANVIDYLFPPPVEKDPGFNWFKTLNWSVGIKEEVNPAKLEVKSHAQDFYAFLPQDYQYDFLPCKLTEQQAQDLMLGKALSLETKPNLDLSLNHTDLTSEAQSLNAVSNATTYCKELSDEQTLCSISNNQGFIASEQNKSEAKILSGDQTQADLSGQEQSIAQTELSNAKPELCSTKEEDKLIEQNIKLALEEQNTVQTAKKSFKEEIEAKEHKIKEDILSNMCKNTVTANLNYLDIYNQNCNANIEPYLLSKEETILDAILEHANVEYEQKYAPKLQEHILDMRSSFLCHLYYLEIYYLQLKGKYQQALELIDLIVHRKILPLYQRSDNFKEIFSLQELIDFPVKLDLHRFDQSDTEFENSFIERSLLQEDLNFLRKCQVKEDRLIALCVYKDVIIRADPLILLRPLSTQESQKEEFIGLFVKHQDLIRVEKLKAIRSFHLEYKQFFENNLISQYSNNTQREIAQKIYEQQLQEKQAHAQTQEDLIQPEFTKQESTQTQALEPTSKSGQEQVLTPSQQQDLAQVQNQDLVLKPEFMQEQTCLQSKLNGVEAKPEVQARVEANQDDIKLSEQEQLNGDQNQDTYTMYDNFMDFHTIKKMVDHNLIKIEEPREGFTLKADGTKRKKPLSDFEIDLALEIEAKRKISDDFMEHINDPLELQSLEPGGRFKVQKSQEQEAKQKEAIAKTREALEQKRKYNQNLLEQVVNLYPSIQISPEQMQELNLATEQNSNEHEIVLKEEEPDLNDSSEFDLEPKLKEEDEEDLEFLNYVSPQLYAPIDSSLIQIVYIDGKPHMKVLASEEQKQKNIKQYKSQASAQAQYQELLCQSISYEYGHKDGTFRGEPRIGEGLVRTLFADGEEIDPSLALIGYISPLFKNKESINVEHMNHYLEPKGAQMVAHNAYNVLLSQREEKPVTMIKTLVKPGRLIVNLKGRWSKKKCKELIDAYLTQQVQELMPILGESFVNSKVYQQNFNDLRPGQYQVQNMSPYGSCMLATGDIILNTMLATLPYHCITAIFAHELCHLKIDSHNTQFHALLRKLFPDTKQTHEDLALTNVYINK